MGARARVGMTGGTAALGTVGGVAANFSDICFISDRRARPGSAGRASGASITLRTADRTVETEKYTDSLAEMSPLESEATGAGTGVVPRW